MHVLSQTSRPDRIAAAYPLLLAAGAVVIERWLTRARRQVHAIARTARAAIPGAILATSLALAPVALPLLAPPALAPLVTALGLNVAAERGKTSPIPQLLADRTGWESFVDDVERVHASLSAADRAHALVYAPSYGHAGALEFFGPSRGMPAVISGQNTYWHWSVGRTDSDVLIAVDANPDGLRRLYADVWEAGASVQLLHELAQRHAHLGRAWTEGAPQRRLGPLSALRVRAARHERNGSDARRESDPESPRGVFRGRSRVYGKGELGIRPCGSRPSHSA